MAAIPDLARYTRMYDSVLGLGKIQDAFMNPTVAFLEQEVRRQRDMERVAGVGKAADLAARLGAFGDEAHVRSRIEAVSEATRMAAPPSLAENLAASFTVPDARRWTEIANIADVACASLSENAALTQSHALQGIMQLAVPDTSASLRALLGNMPTGAEVAQSSLKNYSAAYRASRNPYAAYGPFVHVRRESPPHNLWRDAARNDSQQSTASDYVLSEHDDAEDGFEQTTTGIFVPRRGRPPGITDFTKTQFMEAIDAYMRTEGRFPTIERIAEYINKSDKTVKRWCKRWGISWYELRVELSGN